MSSYDDDEEYPVRRHRSKKGCRPGGTFYLLCLLAGAFACWYSVQAGMFAAMGQNKPLLTIPLSLPDGLALAQQHSQPYTVTGKPSLSAAFVNQVLAQAHSPATGTGQALYDLSVKYTVDDIYALAFFEHESSFGTTGVARVTLSLGNIRCSDGYQCKSGYRAYKTWIIGYEDWYRLIRTLYVETWHLTTASKIIPVYAPSQDGNDVSAYIRAVEQAVDAWKQQAQADVNERNPHET
jgi:hypothetical protein